MITNVRRPRWTIFVSVSGRPDCKMAVNTLTPGCCSRTCSRRSLLCTYDARHPFHNNSSGVTPKMYATGSRGRGMVRHDRCDAPCARKGEPSHEDRALLPRPRTPLGTEPLRRCRVIAPRRTLMAAARSKRRRFDDDGWTPPPDLTINDGAADDIAVERLHEPRW